MPEWDTSEWEKLYIDRYKILVIDPGRIVAIMPLPLIENTDPCMAINAGIKEVAKQHIIKSITSVREKTYETGSHTNEVILIIEPKLGQT